MDEHKIVAFSHSTVTDVFAKQGQKVFWSPSASAKPSETRKVGRKGDIHGMVTEEHMPGNETCNYWMQEGDMYGKKPKGQASF